MVSRLKLAAAACVYGAACLPHPARAQSTPGVTALPPVVVESQRPRRVKQKKGAPDNRVATPRPQPSPQALLTVTPAANTTIVRGPAPVKQKYQLPQTSEGITAPKIAETVNVVDTADAVKYLPSLFVRKRNYGDNQAVLQTRTWGLGSSARTLIYADDILLSNLLGNNNSNASPRWGMISPEEIKRVDFLYGPYAAMYPGNSIGGVLQIQTRMPDKPEFTFRQTEAFQTFDFYKTKDTYRTDQSSVTFGTRWNALSVFFAANFQNSASQPLAWITTGGTPANTNGAVPQLNRIYQTANVIGAGGLLRTEQANVKAKFALDINDWLTATYTIGFLSNDQQSRVETYLTDKATGIPTYGGNASVGGAGFASNTYNLLQENLANAFTLKTDTRGALDGELIISRYDYLTDIQRNPFTVANGATFTAVGRVTRIDGTNWTTVDAKGIWRTSLGGAHEVSFGLHGDRYELLNPVYKTPNWQSAIDATSELYSNSAGKTQTMAAWVQDAWRFAPGWKLTLGGRFESWRAFDGFNLATATNAQTGAINSTTRTLQPSLDASAFSPKGSLGWEFAPDWQATISTGVANRFPTVTELYQTATSGQQIFVPNPSLRPEQALETELAIERKFVDGKVRVSFFQQNTRDAIISQNTSFFNANTNSQVTASVVTNVDETRARGAELAWQKDNVGIRHLELFGSITYVDARILADAAFVPTAGVPVSSAIGRRVPNVPEWRTTLGATYRPTDQWSFTVAGRWQSKTFSTLDNIDTNPNVFQAFDAFVVVDTRVQYKVSQNATLNFGVDNVFNERYHLFHPFPQRTFVLSGKFQF